MMEWLDHRVIDVTWWELLRVVLWYVLLSLIGCVIMGSIGIAVAWWMGWWHDE